MKPFPQWTLEEVEETFNLTACLENPQMQNWLITSSKPTENEAQTLAQLQRKLLRHGYDWNEQESIVYFIGPMLTLVDFDRERYHPSNTPIS